MKKVLSVFLALVMVLSVFIVAEFTASAEDTDIAETGATSGTTGDCTWSLDGTVLTISGNGSMGAYGLSFGPAPWGTEITKLIIKNGVTDIAMYGFAGCKKLSSVDIPGSVTHISWSAFSGCESLKSLTIPDTVTSIGMAAFSRCSGLESITIGSSVTSYLSGVFSDCPSVKSITVSKNNKVFDSRDNSNAIIETKTNSLVLGCKNTVIPNSVTDIGHLAFKGCSDLEAVTIPDSVTNIAEDAFFDCSGLSTIIVSSGNPVFDSRDNCNAIIKTKTNSVVLGCKGTVIPNSVTKIGTQAFSGCSDLTSVNIPDSVVRIGERAFFNCTSLENIAVPDSVISIGYDAFYETPWYENQPDGLVYAGKVAYKYKGSCPSDVEIKEGTVGIADYAFSYCFDLEDVTVPDSVISIGREAFSDTPWYENQPDGLVYAGKVVIGFKNYWDYLLESVEIDEGTLGIGDFAFSYFSDIEAVTIPDSVVNIGDHAFFECASLMSVTIPYSVTNIGDFAFGYYDSDIDNDDTAKIDGFSICGYNGTAAEQYANDNGFTFISLGDKPADMILGDVDGDGVVSVLDATRIQKFKAKLCNLDGEKYDGTEPTDTQMNIADVDTDGVISVLDATRIQKYKAKLCNLDGSTPYTG